MKVLVVEDDRDFLELVEMTLTRAGCEVRRCENGRAVLEAARDYRPDVVLLDVMLPGVDGYTLRHQLAADSATRAIPVVILTALEPSRALFKDGPGTTSFLTKPVRPEDLLKELERLKTT